MTNEQIRKIIQDNLENCWRQMARTEFISVQKINSALCVNSGTSEPLLNSVVNFDPFESKLQQELEQIEHFYSEKYLPFCWWIPDGALFDKINTILKFKGFTQTMEVKGMAMDLNNHALEYTLPANFRIVQAETPAQFTDWMSVLRQAFNMEESAADWYKNLMEKLYQQAKVMPCFTVYHDDKPVSSLSLLLDERAASFYNVGTLPEYQNQGLTTNLSFYCLNLARQQGYSWATLQANTNSVRMYERMGFQSLINYRLYFK